MIDWLTNWLTDWPTDWLINWSSWIIDWLRDWYVDWLTDWPTDWLVDWLIIMNDWVTEWLIYWLTDWLTDWWIDWVSERDLWFWSTRQVNTTVPDNDFSGTQSRGSYIMTNIQLQVQWGFLLLIKFALLLIIFQISFSFNLLVANWRLSPEFWSPSFFFARHGD